MYGFLKIIIENSGDRLPSGGRSLCVCVQICLYAGVFVSACPSVCVPECLYLRVQVFVCRSACICVPKCLCAGESLFAVLYLRQETWTIVDDYTYDSLRIIRPCQGGIFKRNVLNYK